MAHLAVDYRVLPKHNDLARCRDHEGGHQRTRLLPLLPRGAGLGALQIVTDTIGRPGTTTA